MPKNQNNYPSEIIYFGQKIVSYISLKSNYKIERKAMRFLAAHDATDPDIKYLNSKDTQNYLVDIKENNFSLKGNALHGEYIFVLTCENPPKLLCGNKPTHHSYLANGKKVLAAGTLIFDRGALIRLTNNSGHYQPTDSEMLPAIKALYMASGKMLETYESFSSSPPRAYIVKELINTANFAEAIFQSRTSETDPDEQRYGRELRKDLIEFYANIVSYPLFFQSPTSQPESFIGYETQNSPIG